MRWFPSNVLVSYELQYKSESCADNQEPRWWFRGIVLRHGRVEIGGRVYEFCVSSGERSMHGDGDASAADVS